MKSLISILIIITILFISCDSQYSASNNEPGLQQTRTTNDTTPKVIGIGGIFFKSQNNEELKAWYGENLGLVVDQFGSAFEFRDTHRPEEKNYLNWDAFPDTTSYFQPSEKAFMINYRVQNIEGLVKKLRENGATILDEIATYEYGKFVHIMDPEGNKIELWEPVDSVLHKMGRETTK